MNEIAWNWIPTKSVGPFCFGHKIEEYISEYGLIEHVDDYEVSWQKYSIGDGDSLRIYVEDGMIADIACYEGFCFHGFDLIGVTSSNLMKILGATPDQYEEELEIGGEDQMMIIFHSLGLNVWLRPDRTVASVSCHAFLEDE